MTLCILFLAIFDSIIIYTSVLFIVCKMQRETKLTLDNDLELRKLILDKQALEIELKQLQSELEVTEIMPGEEVSKKKRIDELREKLEEKYEEKEYWESVHQGLIAKKTAHTNELRPARKKLIDVSYENYLSSCPVLCNVMLSMMTYRFCVASEQHSPSDLLLVWQGFLDLTNGRGNIGIKRIGKLEEKAFLNACKTQLPKDDAEFTAAILYSKWEAQIENWSAMFHGNSTVHTFFPLTELLISSYQFRGGLVVVLNTSWLPISLDTQKFMNRSVFCQTPFTSTINRNKVIQI